MSRNVFVLVLNYRRAEDTLECLRSVYASSYSSLKAVLVDNGSGDGCVERAQKEFPELHAIENEKNLGYAEGNNRGIRWAMELGADYVFVLNNDATVRRDTVEKLVKAGEASPEAGILAPKVLLYDRPEIIDSCGTNMDWFRLRPRLGACGSHDSSSWRGNVEGPVFPGSALMLKRVFIEKAGLFDQEFFLVHEDADLCFRSLKHGFKNRLVADAVVYHKVSRTLSSLPFQSEYYATRNFLYLARRHASLASQVSAAAGVAALSLWKGWRYFFSRDDNKRKIEGFFCGVRDYWARREGPWEDRP